LTISRKQLSANSWCISSEPSDGSLASFSRREYRQGADVFVKLGAKKLARDWLALDTGRVFHHVLHVYLPDNTQPQHGYADIQTDGIIGFVCLSVYPSVSYKFLTRKRCRKTTIGVNRAGLTGAIIFSSKGQGHKSLDVKNLPRMTHTLRQCSRASIGTPGAGKVLSSS